MGSGTVTPDRQPDGHRQRRRRSDGRSRSASPAARQLTKAGPGTLVLSGNNAYTGATYRHRRHTQRRRNMNSTTADVWVGHGSGRQRQPERAGRRQRHRQRAACRRRRLARRRRDRHRRRSPAGGTINTRQWRRPSATSGAAGPAAGVVRGQRRHGQRAHQRRRQPATWRSARSTPPRHDRRQRRLQRAAC